MIKSNAYKSLKDEGMMRNRVLDHSRLGDTMVTKVADHQFLKNKKLKLNEHCTIFNLIHLLNSFD